MKVKRPGPTGCINRDYWGTLSDTQANLFDFVVNSRSAHHPKFNRRDATHCSAPRKFSKKDISWCNFVKKQF